jgi:hypothetical protein
MEMVVKPLSTAYWMQFCMPDWNSAIRLVVTSAHLKYWSR